MKKKTKWWLCLAPMYIFTLLFILGPIIYMFVVSFATNNSSGYGFTWTFTLENFARMLDPVMWTVLYSHLSWRFQRQSLSY